MRLIASFLAVAALAVGGSSFAIAGSTPAKPAVKHAKAAKAAKHHARHSVALRKATTETPGETASSENDADAAAQDAACKAAGVDPNGSNVNYDDATGTCSNNG
jgi:hypothetical protein